MQPSSRLVDSKSLVIGNTARSQTTKRAIDSSSNGSKRMRTSPWRTSGYSVARTPDHVVWDWANGCMAKALTYGLRMPIPSSIVAESNVSRVTRPTHPWSQSTPGDIKTRQSCLSRLANRCHNFVRCFFTGINWYSNILPWMLESKTRKPPNPRRLSVLSSAKASI